MEHNPMNFADLAPHFADETKAIELVERLMWPKGAVCPHCQATERQYQLKGKATRPGLRKCGLCRKQYTVKIGTIFEDSKIPLSKWLIVIYMMCSSKKGVSANQISRAIGVSYKSAWHLCHRIRTAMTKEPMRGMLGKHGGTVELDETYIGGKRRNNKHKNRTAAAGKKIAVMTLIERGGDVATIRLPDTRKSTLQTIARPIVDRSANIVTDSHPGYRGMDQHFASHETVDHSKEFVRGLIYHTNFAESYHALLKRSIIGTHHHISEKHMPKYLREREFMWNARKATDGERLVSAIKGAKGKRLMYQAPKS
jgi:transposase-like protein